LADEKQERIGYLGKQSEKLFSSWCTLARLDAQKTDVDEYGWDILVEAPTPRVESFHDLAPVGPKFFVQVKGTDAAERIDISLKNWRHLCATPQPAFVVVMAYAGADSPAECRVIHVGEELMTWALERLAQLAPGDDPHGRTTISRGK